MVETRRGTRWVVHPLFQLLANLEEGQALGGHVNRLAHFPDMVAFHARGLQNKADEVAGIHPAVSSHAHEKGRGHVVREGGPAFGLPGLRLAVLALYLAVALRLFAAGALLALGLRGGTLVPAALAGIAALAGGAFIPGGAFLAVAPALSGSGSVV